MRRIILILLAIGASIQAVNSQTLGEVLRATQNRNRLQTEAYHAGGELISWHGGLPPDPSDAQVDALPVEDQIAVLRQAWFEVEGMAEMLTDYYGTGFIDARNYSGGSGIESRVRFDRFRPSFSPEDMPSLLRILAQRLQRLNTVVWWPKTTSDDYLGGYHYEDDLASLPTTISLEGANFLYEIPTGGKYKKYDDNGNFLGYRYAFFVDLIGGPANFRMAGSQYFPGRVAVLNPREYAVRIIQGLGTFPLPGVSESFYDPGTWRVNDAPITVGGEVNFAPPGNFGPNAVGLSISGEWIGDDSSGFEFKPDFIGQPGLGIGAYKSIVPDGSVFWGEAGTWVTPVFTADFQNEFSSLGDVPPQKPAAVELVQNLKQKELYVVIDPAPGTCHLIWDFSYYFSDYYITKRTSLSMRNILTVAGSGDWDAVYSGMPEDREPEIQWGESGEVQTGRPNFNSYIYEWWQPVLTQLVTPTTGVNIVQESPVRYRLDFYRRDQVGDKDTATGRYSFSGLPFATWAVENPASNYANRNSVRISTSDGAVYDLVRTETLDGSSVDSTTYTLTGVHGGSEFLNVDVHIDGPWGLLEAVESASMDGVALPGLETTFYDRGYNGYPDIEEVVETGTEGTRTTNFSDGNPSQQTGGPTPYSATYNSADMLTGFQSGSTSVEIVYDGATVTRVEKLNGTTVRTLTTTYSEGMRVAETTASDAPGAVTALVERYPGTDSVNPWALKVVRDFDGSLTTFSYAWEGDLFVTETRSGRGTSPTATTVAAGTRTVTKVNSAAMVVSEEVFDIESGAKLDFAVATAFQAGTPFPSTYSRPLGTTEQYSYDGQGRVLTHTDRLGVMTTYERDALGRIDQITRGTLTWEIEHNPGFLGRRITCGGRTWTEQTSPFGGTMMFGVEGPEEIEVTRTETPSTLTISSTNLTTGQAMTSVINKGTLQSVLSGNAVALAGGDFWTTTFAPSTRTWTTTNSAAAALTSSVQLDGLGRPVTITEPSASGAGTTETTLSYAGGLLTAIADADGTAELDYHLDGSLKKVERDGRFLSVDRVASTATEIKWRWTNAAGDNLWERVYHPATGVIEDLPWGETARKLTTTPSVSGDVFTLSASGPNLAGSMSWKDGAPSAGTLQAGALTRSWTAQANSFGEMTELVRTLGGAGSQTWQFSELGLPTSASALAGLDSTTFASSFPSGGFSLSATRNGKTRAREWSPAGLPTEETGYGVPDQTWSLPSLGNSVTRTLTTGAGSAGFTWNPVGTLKERSFPDGTDEQFGYSAGGLPESWTKAGGTTLPLAPNAFGQPTRIGNVVSSIGYDDAGRLQSVSDEAGTHTRTYVDGQIDLKSHSGGPLAGQWVDRDYDSLGRLSEVKLSGGVSVGYTYGSNGALETVSTASGLTGTWSNDDPVTGKAKAFSLGPLSTARTFDALGRLSGHASAGPAGTLAYGYGYDGFGQCTGRDTPEGGWTLGYNSHGYLSSASRPGKSLSYTFDEAGRPSGATDYRPTSRANQSEVEIFGSVNHNPLAAVTINGSPVAVDPVTGHFSLTESPGQGWHTYTVRGALAGLGHNGTDAIAEEVRQVFLPPPSESLSYNTDGSLGADARWTFGWNELDQLISAEETNPPPSRGAMRLDFLYDWLGRRVEKKVSEGGQTLRRSTFLYDGWRLMRETEHTASGYEAMQRIYTWGPDISGTLDGAAGIGGLIEILETRGGSTTVSLPVTDGTGNIVGLMDGSTGALVAGFEFGPFGELINATGSRAASCPLRFQTKYWDEELGLCYFGKRYYDPSTQTWISRDPLREAGGVNLYAYCNNQPLNYYDAIGGEPVPRAPLAEPGNIPIIPRPSRPATLLDIFPATGTMIGGGRSPYGSEAAAVGHSRNVTMPMMGLTLTGAYGVAGLSLGAPAIATGGPLLYAGAGDLALKGYVTMQTSTLAQAGVTGLAGYHLYNFATDESYRGATISIDGGLGFSSVAYAGADLFNVGRGLVNTVGSRLSVSSGGEFLPWALSRGSVGSGVTLGGTVPGVTTVDRIRQVGQTGFDYAVQNPRIMGLNRMQLGKDAEVQATRWMRRWAERNGVDMGPGGLQFQVRGANSVPDIVYDPAFQIFDFKLTPKAVRPAQGLNFQTDFPGYDVEYIFGP